MEKISLFTPINYARPRSHIEEALSTLTNYFYLGGTRAIVVRGDEVRLKVGKVSWYTIALKVASYILLFPLTLILLTVTLSLRSQHNFTVIRSSPAITESNQKIVPQEHRFPPIERHSEFNAQELTTQISDKDLLKDIFRGNVVKSELVQKHKNQPKDPSVDFINNLNSPLDLPKDILFEIIKNLDLKDIKNINLLNKQWHTFLSSNYQWILKNHIQDLNFKSALKLACLCGPSLEELDFRPIPHQQQYQKKDEDLELLVKSCPNLKKLRLPSSPYITEKGVSYLAKLPLQELELDYSLAVTDKALEHLSHLPLQILSLYHSHKINDEGIKPLVKLPLKKLILENCNKLTDKCLDDISQLKLLELNLGHCPITDEGLKKLALVKIPIQTLNLENCPITDNGLQYIAELPLKELSLQGCAITGEGFKELALKKTPLQMLDVSNCRNITDKGLEYIAKLPIVFLDLNNTPFSDNGLKHLANMAIQALDIGRTQITDNGLSSLMQMPLRKLNLSYCNITNDGLKLLFTLPLEVLLLRKCVKITNIGLTHLAKLPLRELNIIKCKKITDKFLENYENIGAVIEGENNNYQWIRFYKDKSNIAGRW